jgi:hypothetical protein
MNRETMVTSVVGAAVLLMIALVFFVESRVVKAQEDFTPRGGEIRSNETWTRAESPYLLTERVLVTRGVTLTIEPGVEVRSAGVELTVQGHLEAVGTQDEPITFTSEDDTDPKEWVGIVMDGSEGQGTANLAFATVRYTTRQNSLGVYSAVTVSGVDVPGVRILNSTIRDSFAEGAIGQDIRDDYGVYVVDSTVAVINTTFQNIGLGSSPLDYPLYAQGKETSLRLLNNTFTENAVNRVLLEDIGSIAGRTANAQYVFPYAEGLEGYELVSTLTVPISQVMKVEPGTKILSRRGVGVNVYGYLRAVGTSEQPITFTATGNSNGPDWVGMVFDGSKGNGTGYLRYARFSLGGQRDMTDTYSNITVNGVQDGAVYLEHCEIAFAQAPPEIGRDMRDDYGLLVNNGVVMIDKTTFRKNGLSGIDYALCVRGDESVVQLIDSIFSNNTNDMCVRAGSVTVEHSDFGEGSGYAIRNFASQVVEAPRNWWGEQSGPTHPDNSGGSGRRVGGNVDYTDALSGPPIIEEEPEKEGVYIPLVQR